jgi:two-component system, chemotaxis family, response regulator Rcp1
MMNKQLSPMDILLVEDNPADVRLTKEALGSIKVSHTLHNVSNGHHAISFLRKQDKYASAPRPDIILLDLNLPVKDGRQVLSELKVDSDLRNIPIIVLTTSQRKEDIKAAYDLHANCYIVKPIDFDQFCEAIKSIESFWFTTVALPEVSQ